jgi:hypothetical protein
VDFSMAHKVEIQKHIMGPNIYKKPKREHNFGRYIRGVQDGSIDERKLHFNDEQTHRFLDHCITEYGVLYQYKSNDSTIKLQMLGNIFEFVVALFFEKHGLTNTPSV